MSIADREFENVTYADLVQLKDNQVAEGFLYEYKLHTYGGSDDDKREALKDVSSFANSAGGHIVIGMDEQQGLPTDLAGIVVDADEEIRRLDNLFRDCIEPRIIGLRMRSIALQNERIAILIRVPNSWARPHRASYKNTRRYFVRNSAGAHEASVEELRAMFTAGMTIHEQARSFREVRTRLIESGQAPVPVHAGGRMILHIVPVAAFTGTLQIDMRTLPGSAQLPPLTKTGYNYTHNVDGFLTFGSVVENGYLQLFRNGAIETVAPGLLKPDRSGHPVCYAPYLERIILSAADDYLEALSKLDVPPPLIFTVTLEGMMGALVLVDTHATAAFPEIRQPKAYLPEVVFDDYGSPAQYRRRLRPVADAVWNAAGTGGSPNYDDNGDWASPVK
jgi:Putative DNA-binding domain